MATPPSRGSRGAATGASSDALPIAVILVYALPGAGVSFQFSLILVMYLNFGNVVLGVAPGVLGAIFFASKIWDAISDPLAGRISDRTRSRWGRRKPWLFVSSLPLAAFSLAAWAPPEALAGPALLGWIAVAVFGFYTAYTLFEVPHMALGAELSHHRATRVRVFAFRQLLRTLGLFAAFGIGASLLEDLESARRNALALALGLGGFSAATTLLAVFALPAERSEYVGRAGESLWAALRDVLRNPHARILLFVQFVDHLATGGIGVLVPYVVRYVMQTPDLIAEMLLLYTLPAVLSIPVWMRLARRFEKRRLWLFAMGMSGTGFGLLWFLHEGSVALMAVAATLAGSASGCGATLGTALKADVIDFDEYRTGERKEGAYFAAWSFVSKLAAGVMVGTVGLALEWVDFDPELPVSQTAKQTLRFLVGGVPVIGFGLGMLAMLRFRLSERLHARIRMEIEARGARATS